MLFLSSKGHAVRKVLRAFFLFSVCAFLASCEMPEFLRPGMGLKPGAPASAPKAAGVAEPTGLGTLTPREKFAFHSWLVTEMQEQIFARPLKDKAGNAGWANVLSQKGSIEGVYHGFILSSEYLALENAKPADLKALRFFGLEMALMDFPSSTETDPKIQEVAAKYVTEHSQSSIYTLKRELGERILREADRRKNDLEKLAAWYSGIAARWAKLDIPFGLPQRSNPDEIFHFQWAKDNTLGMVQWELLNREHRIFNHLAGISVKSK